MGGSEPRNSFVSLRSDAVGQRVVVICGMLAQLHPTTVRLERIRHAIFFGGGKVLP